MKKKNLLAAALALIMLLSGCARSVHSAVNTAARSMDMADFAAEESMSVMAAGSAAPAARKASASADNGSEASPILPEGRKWIISMNISAETEDLDAALAALNSRINAMGGYIENQSMTNGSIASARARRNASMTVRIPAEQCDAFLEEVSEIYNVVSSSRNVTDITLAYADTEGRITALRAEEARLLELMSRAEDMRDLLEIEQRLTDVRYELERFSSTLRRYDNQVDYATIDLYISQVTRYTPPEEVSFGQRISRGLADSITDLGIALTDLAAWFIIDLPYLLLLALAAWGVSLLIRRRIRKIKTKKAEKSAASESRP